MKFVCSYLYRSIYSLKTLPSALILLNGSIILSIPQKSRIFVQIDLSVYTHRNGFFTDQD